jgi:alkanesulfonate monooxygenase SsuD/methylene tetrahydromethanopterin reductase-like flavin-dependent oxidoreductase (luciferase family)
LELGGEVADGVHMAPGYTRRTIDYCLGLIAGGASHANRDHRRLDLAMGPIFVVAQDGALAREAARIHTTFYLPFMVASFFEAINDTDYDYSIVQRIKETWLSGDIRGAADMVPHDLARLYYVAGTPQECVATLKANLDGTDINHLTLMIVDNGHVEMIRGESLPGLPSLREQLQVIHDEIMPEFQ